MSKASCKECPSYYELIPPPESEYKIPKENKESDDVRERVYKCEKGHENRIFWHKEEVIDVTSDYKATEPYMSTR